VLGGIHAPLVDAGIVQTPYMVSFAFLAIVLALSYELVSNAVLASRYAKEIQANERRWRSLLTNVDLAVIGIDPQGRITDANPFLERLTGFSSEALTGKPIRALIAAEDRAELDARLAAAAQSGPRPRSRWNLLCRSGERRALVWSTVGLLHDPKRRPGHGACDLQTHRRCQWRAHLGGEYRSRCALLLHAAAGRRCARQ
jgi:PAS domain S-box-containing protein